MKLILSLVSIVALLGASGCSSAGKPEAAASQGAGKDRNVASKLAISDSAALQGTWQGREIEGETEGTCCFVVS